MSRKTFTIGFALATLFGAASDVAIAQRSTPPSQGSAATAPQGTPPKPAPGAPTNSGRKPWWTDDASKKELGLTADQTKTLNDIYMSTKDELASYADARDREFKELERLIDEGKAERWLVGRQIDKFETQRSNYNKLRTMTIYRMHQVLTPEQRVKLQAIEARNHRDPRRRP